MKYLTTRAAVARYLRISRMTLNRWEKILPLPHNYLGCHVVSMETSKIDDWHERVRRKHNMKQEFITHRRERTTT